jgi:DNA-binding LytR/AlgR family response regulator
MNALIIEDEPHARAELKRLLNKVAPQISIVAELDSVTDACTFLASGKPFDLVFADIQLSDGLSFDIFNQINISQPVIFTTAYNEFAIKAFDLNSIDYLLKPIEENQLEKALAKLNRIKENYNNQSLMLSAEKLKELLSVKKEYKSRFVTKIGDQFKYIGVDELAYFNADDNVVYAITHQQQKVIVDYKMEELELVLDPKLFFRANRGFMVHIKAIQKVHKYFNSRLSLEVLPKTEEPVLVSRLKVDDFLNWMDQ